MTLFDVDLTEEPDPPAATVRLVVAYDGTDFHGFAVQPRQGVRTVGGVLNEAIGTVLRAPVDLTCAGRTDAGVHAHGQVLSFPAPPDCDPVRLANSLNSMLGPEVVVRDAQIVPGAFDARYDARWRRYRYSIVNRPVPDPFTARFAWHMPKPLDLRALHLAADVFVGEHDFAAFCRKGPERSTTIRRVLQSQWFDDGDGRLRYEVQANAFCWQMVRSLVGVLVEVGLGKRRPGDILAVLRAGDRSGASQLAPAHGLCLWEVGYDDAPAAS